MGQAGALFRAVWSILWEYFMLVFQSLSSFQHLQEHFVRISNAGELIHYQSGALLLKRFWILKADAVTTIIRLSCSSDVTQRWKSFIDAFLFVKHTRCMKSWNWLQEETNGHRLLLASWRRLMVCQLIGFSQSDITDWQNSLSALHSLWTHFFYHYWQPDGNVWTFCYL